MKKLTMSIFIILVITIPIADTQVEQPEVVAIVGAIINVKVDIPDIDKVLEKLMTDELLKKGKRAIFTNELTDRWTKAIIVNAYLIDKERTLFIVNHHIRLPEDMIHPDFQPFFENTDLPLVLFPKIIPYTYEWKRKDKEEGMTKVLNEITRDSIEFLMLETFNQSK